MFEPMTRDQVQRLADEPIFRRAEEYLACGAVEKRTREPGGITARVLGQTDYRVEISVGPRFQCSCPFDFSGPCKHVVATLLAWADEPGSFLQPHRLAKLLRNTPRASIESFLLELFDDAPEIGERFASWRAGLGQRMGRS